MNGGGTVLLMNAQDLLRRADEYGVQLEVRDGGGVSLRAPHRPPKVFLSELQSRKFEVVAYLAEHRRTVLDVPDAWAAAVAFERAVSAFLAQYQVASSSWHCDWCGRGPTADAAVLPMPIVGGDRVRLHAECWPSWRSMHYRCASISERARSIRSGPVLLPGTA
jgi:hypothetical protein